MMRQAIRIGVLVLLASVLPVPAMRADGDGFEGDGFHTVKLTGALVLKGLAPNTAYNGGFVVREGSAKVTAADCPQLGAFTTDAAGAYTVPLWKAGPWKLLYGFNAKTLGFSAHVAKADKTWAKSAKSADSSCIFMVSADGDIDVGSWEITFVTTVGDAGAGGN